jgi:hypothetical protein
MSTRQIVKILRNHAIAHRLEDNRLYALEEYTQTLPDASVISGSKWVEVTRWDFLRLMLWLGY